MVGKEVRIGACLLAGDMECMVRFYRDTLGFHTEWDGGDFVEFKTVNCPYLCIAGRHSCRQLVKATFRPGE